MLIYVGADNNTSDTTESISTAKISNEADKNAISQPDPLPASIFTPEIASLLSPEIFSQHDPLTYLYRKARRMFYQIDKIRYTLKSTLVDKKFPQPYVPYAQLLHRLLPCLADFSNVIQYMVIIRLQSRSLMYRKPDISTSDPDLLDLYADDIFSDPNIPLCLLRKLLDIPGEEISNVSNRLKNLSFNRDFSQMYVPYTRWIYKFLDQNLLTPLKRSLVRLQNRSTIEQDYKNYSK